MAVLKQLFSIKMGWTTVSDEEESALMNVSPPPPPPRDEPNSARASESRRTIRLGAFLATLASSSCLDSCSPQASTEASTPSAGSVGDGACRNLDEDRS